MKRKELEGWLGRLNGFSKPNVLLEQYATSAEIAATMLHLIEQRDGSIGGRVVADLGCGCGTLGIGAALLGAAWTFAFDVDASALELCSENVHDVGVQHVHLVQCDVSHLIAQPSWHGSVDTVVMNPPFGTKRNQGADVVFLNAAVHMARSAVYSLHKTSTREFVITKGKQLGCEVEVLAQLKFDLPSSYRFHKLPRLDIEVDLIQFTKAKRAM